MTAWPVVVVGLAVAAYWIIGLVRSMSRSPDWTWPPPSSRRAPFESFELTRNQYRLAAAAGIVASLAVCVFAVVALG